MRAKERYHVSVQVMLIRQIQTGIGQQPCYATVARDSCPKTNCCWRSDCYCEDDFSACNDEVPAHNSQMDFYQERG